MMTVFLTKSDLQCNRKKKKSDLHCIRPCTSSKLLDLLLDSPRCSILQGELGIVAVRVRGFLLGTPT